MGWLRNTGAGNGGKCSNCYSIGVISVGLTVHNVGGLVGANWGDINNCYSKGAVFTAGNYDYHTNCGNFGGLVGANGGYEDYSVESGYISNSWSSCDVIGGVGSWAMGGLVGGSGLPGGNISNCYATGTVSGGGSLGGLVGGGKVISTIPSRQALSSVCLVREISAGLQERVKVISLIAILQAMLSELVIYWWTGRTGRLL